MSQFSISRIPHRETARSFADSLYLFRVIGRLHRERLRQGLHVEAVARKARLKPRVIEQAERLGNVPNSKNFKAWATALGFPWDQLWSDCLPESSGSPIEHRT